MKPYDRLHSWLPHAGLAYLAIFWGALTWLLVSRLGLFHTVGVDFGAFYAAAHTFLADGPGAVYDLNKMAIHLEPLRAYYGPSATELKVSSVPYPPIFILLFMPFTTLPPVVGYLVWVLVNAGLCAYVVRDIAKRLNVTGWVVVITVLLTHPIVPGLWVGQAIGFWLMFFYLAYRAFERGDDLQAGVWLGFLLIKPQLAVGLVFVLLWKQRWRALASTILTRGAIAITSLAILGLDGFITFYRSIIEHASAVPEIATPDAKEAMISWRGVVAALAGGHSESQELIVTLVLSLITLATLPIIWRGEWRPDEPRFALQILGTAIVTVLAGYDMHFHGAAVLIVPAAILVLRGDGPSMISVVAFTSLYVLPLITPLEVVPLVFVVLMLVALVTIVVGERPRQPEGSVRPPVASDLA